MRIIVTTGAVQALPVVNHRRLWLELRRFLVTVGAGDCNVPPGEHKARCFVFGEREGGRLVSLEIVTAIAGIEVRPSHKLPGMLIGVAIGAAIEFDFEQRVLPFRDVTLHALQPRMPALQRIGAGGMLLHRESRRLPSLDVVT